MATRRAQFCPRAHADAETQRQSKTNVDVLRTTSHSTLPAEAICGAMFQVCAIRRAKKIERCRKMLAAADSPPFIHSRRWRYAPMPRAKSLMPPCRRRRHERDAMRYYDDDATPVDTPRKALLRCERASAYYVAMLTRADAVSQRRSDVFREMRQECAESAPRCHRRLFCLCARLRPFDTRRYYYRLPRRLMSAQRRHDAMLVAHITTLQPYHMTTPSACCYFRYACRLRSRAATRHERPSIFSFSPAC